MSAPTSINKKDILNFIYKYLSIFTTIIILIYTAIYYTSENNITNYLFEQKQNELKNISQSVSNEILNSDYRTARNKLSLVKNSNTFEGYLVIDEKNQIIDSNISSIEEVSNLKSVDIKIYYPGTSDIHSTIKYFYQFNNFNYSKKILFRSMLLFLVILTLSFVVIIYILIKYIDRYSTEYELEFKNIIENPRYKIKKTSNPLLPSLYNLSNNLIEIENKSVRINKLEKDKYKFDLAKKIAHDIRSPISTLNLISSKIEDPTIKELQTMVVEQINSIANNLLNESNSFSNRTDNSTTSLMNILKQIEQEFEFKKVSFKRTIQFNLDEINFDKFTISKEQSKILYSCINNFIQNSIEATADDGVIEVIVKKSDVNGKSYEIIVKDNGKGIPDHILAKLGTEAISYGKEANNSFNSGNGIALFNAKKDLNQIGADLKIKSQINIGTEITICI